MMRVIVLFIILAAALGACKDGNQASEDSTRTQDELMVTGSEITKQVGQTLVKTVQQKMSEGGVEGAVDFCRINALAITDSLSKAHGVRIKRTATKTRNSDNEPSELEREVLGKMMLQSPPQPVVLETESGGPVYFEPIALKAFCQTCHGTPGETMAVETDSIIKTHYPNDRATGFADGDLRGMWAVYFNDKQ